MLSPLDSILITVGVAGVLMLLERVNPLHPYSQDKLWVLRLIVLGGMGVTLTTITGAYILPLLGNASLSGILSRFFSTKPAWLNGLFGYFCISFFVYWWHRLRHHSNFMWKVFHQIHHSTHRLQALTALYAHPSDFLANAFIINAVAYCLLGFDVNSAAWAALWVAIFEFWEHTNIPTPHWLGYIIVRPEMHRIHHERYRHTNNYGIPLWDLLFGTYENSSRKVDCGFESEAEKQLSKMLNCKVVE